MKFPQNNLNEITRKNFIIKSYLPRYKKLFADHSNRNSYLVNQVSIHLFGFADIKG